MNEFFNAMLNENSQTHNGAVTHSTSLDKCVDFFFLAGASRKTSEADILSAFNGACAENKEVALKLLFWARDCRGGAGEKRLFQIILNDIYNNHKTYGYNILSLLDYIPEYGYYKDIFKTLSPDNILIPPLVNQLLKGDNLLAKYWPRKGPWFTIGHKQAELNPKDFRKKLVEQTKVVENLMCDNRWNEIEYSKVPSVAMNMYRRAFVKNDGDRFNQFNVKVIDGKEKVNASVLHPHTLYRSYEEGQNRNAIRAQWESLPDFMKDCMERILPVCDVSGSMTGLPMEVSISLGCYISERNKGIFKDAFMTFSAEPELNYLKGNIIQKFNQLQKAKWGYNTDLQKTFEIILEKSIKNGIPQNQMPTKILIISDMEFDAAGGNTNLDAIKQKYKKSGYELPGIIFWNVNGRLNNVPAKANTPNTALVSGFSPSIMESLLGGEEFTPKSVMLKTINKERYANISA